MGRRLSFRFPANAAMSKWQHKYRFERVNEMSSPSVYLPRQGEYKLLKLETVPRTERDQSRSWQRYDFEMHWVPQGGRKEEVLFASAAVDRGAVFVLEVGIRDP